MKDTSNKKKKNVLFHVDINMDSSKVVRVAIHENDNIDRIVEKFDSLFKLKPKQKMMLKQRIKKQYNEMMDDYDQY